MVELSTASTGNRSAGVHSAEETEQCFGIDIRRKAQKAELRDASLIFQESFKRREKELLARKSCN